MSSNTSNWKNINDGETINYQPQIDEIKYDLNKQQKQIEDMKTDITTEYIETDALNMPNSTDDRITINGITDAAALEDEINDDDKLATPACFKQFFDLIYPIGSMRIEYNELQGEHVVESGNAVLIWLFGSKWQPVSLNGRHIKGTQPSYPNPPTTWTLPYLKHYGGAEYHKHSLSGTHACANITINAAYKEVWNEPGAVQYTSSNVIYGIDCVGSSSSYDPTVISGSALSGETEEASNEYKSIELAFYIRIA